METMWQLAYDRTGIKCHVGCNYQYWNDACWHRAVPLNTQGLSYLDVGCCNGVFTLRFAQSGGRAVGMDGLDGTIVNAKTVPNLGQPIETNIKTFAILRDEFKIDYLGLVGGFDEDGRLHPEGNDQYDIVSCMNTIEYIKNPLRCLDSLKSKTKSRLIVCTDVTKKATYQLPNQSTRCTISNLDEIIKYIGWPCTLWTFEAAKDFPLQGFFVFDHPDSTLPSFDKTPPTFNMDISETQRNRSH